MAAKKIDKQINVELPPIDIRHFTLRIVGDSPLITHAWDEKAKRMMLNKQQKKATNGREIRRPYAEFANSLYWLTPKPKLDGLTNEEVQDVVNEAIPHAKFGFPTVGFKASAIDAGYQQGAMDKKTTARGAFHIDGEFATIEGTTTAREVKVKIGKGIAELRYRAEFTNWATTLAISYNHNAMSLEQIINLFNLGGYANGVGEWRPAKDGGKGRFHVAIGEQD